MGTPRSLQKTNRTIGTGKKHKQKGGIAHQGGGKEMGNKQLRDDIENRKRKQERKTNKYDTIAHPFWNGALVIVSLLHGAFILRQPGYLISHSQIHFGDTTEIIIGLLLIVFSLTKLAGKAIENQKLWRISIMGLSFIWTGLFLVSFVYSFGIGRPNPAWYFYGFVMVGCYGISLSGGK